MRLHLVHGLRGRELALPAATWTVFAHDAASGDLMSVARVGANARIQHLARTRVAEWRGADAPRCGATRITAWITPYFSSRRSPYDIQLHTAPCDGARSATKHGLQLWVEWTARDVVAVELCRVPDARA